MKIIITDRFHKDFKRLKSLRSRIQKQIDYFIEDNTHPSLQSEKLSPKKYERYSFRINKQYRVIYTFQNKVPVLLYISKHYE